MAREEAGTIPVTVTRMRKIHVEKLWLMWKELGWSKAKLKRESGIDYSIIQSFCEYKFVRLRPGSRLAITIIGGLIEKADS